MYRTNHCQYSPKCYSSAFRNLLVGSHPRWNKGTRKSWCWCRKNPSYAVLGRGWKYWEEDTITHPYITPYVLRSISLLKQLGVSIPDASTDAGLSYLSDMVDYRSDLLSKDINLRAQVYLTLAQYNHPKASLLRTSLEAEFKKSLSPASAPISTHAYLLYAYGLFMKRNLPLMLRNISNFS